MATKAEKTKEYIIATSAPIFNKQGYAGTSMSDITKATGLTKGVLYGNFKCWCCFLLKWLYLSAGLGRITVYCLNEV